MCCIHFELFNVFIIIIIDCFLPYFKVQKSVLLTFFCIAPFYDFTSCLIYLLFIEIEFHLSPPLFHQPLTHSSLSSAGANRFTRFPYGSTVRRTGALLYGTAVHSKPPTSKSPRWGSRLAPPLCALCLPLHN